MAKKVVVIGSGPGGYPAALKLKALGAEVCIIEKLDFGGTCLNRGCIPSKSFLDAAGRIRSSEILKTLLKDGKFFDFNPDMLSWDKIKERKNSAIKKIKNSLEKLFELNKIEIIKGAASFASKNEIAIRTEREEIRKNFDFAVIAAGTVPFFPPPFIDYKNELLDSDRIFDVPGCPASIIIIGAGAIGLEFACFFNALGAKTDVVEILPEILPGEDETVARTARNSFEKRGIKFHLSRKTVKITISENEKTLELDNGLKITAAEILVGAGRAAELSELGLENAGLKWDRKGIRVNEYTRTEIENIYAVGDVNGISMLAHSATRQGEIAAENIFGAQKRFDLNLVPKCVYTRPEIASIGLNRKQAEAQGLNPKTSRAYFQSSGFAITHDETDGFVQIVYHADNDAILGAQIAGGPATELIHLFSIPVQLKLKRKDLLEAIYAHPTMAETIHEALSR